MKKEKHTFNGKLQGIYYELDDGRKLYLAHRQRKHIYRQNNAWCLDVMTLDRIRNRGITAVGVIMRDAGQRLVWLTHIDDFYESPHSFGHFFMSKQRGLPLSRFRVDPAKNFKVIEKSVKLR